MELPLDTSTTHVAFSAKPTYKLCFSIGIHTHELAPNKCLLDTATGLNLINANLIHLEWINRVKHTDLPRFRTATKEPIHLQGTILLHHQIGNLNTRVWFSIFPNLAVDLLLGTSFVDRFIRGIFPGERKVEPWHSQPVAIRASHHKENSETNAPITADNSPKPADTSDAHPVRLARQMMIPPNTAKTIMVTTTASGLLTIIPRPSPPKDSLR